MEFKLKTSENHLKSSCFTINILGQYELVLLIPSKIHEKIVEFPLNKTEKLTKIANKSLKSIKKYWDSTTHTL
jgi:hypothetical protein